MGSRHPTVDAKIEAASPSVRPVMTRLRAWVHRHGPKGLEEAIKWNHPSFLYNGRIFCFIAGFKRHASFGFWHPALRGEEEGSVMSRFGRLESVDDLPAETVFAKQMREAIRLADSDEKPAPVKKKRRPSLPMPDDLAKALEGHATAAITFRALRPSHQREYIEWITEAKRPETRERRLATTIENLADGRSLHAKYERRS